MLGEVIGSIMTAVIIVAFLQFVVATSPFNDDK